MKITRKSPFTGEVNTMDLPVTAEQMAEFEGPGRRLIQEIFPDLTKEQREFILTGYTPGDWDAIFADGED